LKLPAGILNRSAWGLMLLEIFYISLVLDACSLQLGAWSLELGAWSLELGTCRPGFLLLGA